MEKTTIENDTKSLIECLSSYFFRIKTALHLDVEKKKKVRTPGRLSFEQNPIENEHGKN